MSKTIYTCQNCAATSSRWQGKCFECNAWNSFVEERAPQKTTNAASKTAGQSRGELAPLKSYAQSDGHAAMGRRISSGFGEVDRVLGGGFLEGSLLLFGGSPGIGKSTLLLQVIAEVAQKMPSLYISGEESGAQVASRAARLELFDLSKEDNLQFLSSTRLEESLEAAEKSKARFIVVDSVQTLASGALQSASGTVSQVREVTQAFLDLAKAKNVTVALVGHITKEGNIAGPKLLEHMVDGVFFFDLSANGAYRLLKGHKNRFGPTHELAVFEMKQKGMQEVTNPSERFLEERNTDAPGSAVVAHLEGSQSFLTEIQSLTQTAAQGFPRRTMQGVDQNRVSVLLAVLEKSLGLNFSGEDVYCKVASGAKIVEAASDLAIAMSLVSALLNKALPADLLCLGEVGLGGEVRSVSAPAIRLAEAKSVGIKRAFVPKWNAKELEDTPEVECIPIKSIEEVYKSLF